MTNNRFFTLWGLLFIICAGLGFIPEPIPVMTALSVLFFLPPALILYRSKKSGDTAAVRLVRNLSLLSLGLTLLLLIANFLSVIASEAVGTALYLILIIVSAPMVCSGYWVLSLFLWACLLAASLHLLRRR